MPYQLRPSTVLYKHQEEATKWADNVEGGLLAADTGTGKTTMALNLARTGSLILIVVPTSLLDQWKREAIARFTIEKSDVVTFHGAEKMRRLERFHRSGPIGPDSLRSSKPNTTIFLTTIHTLWRNIDSLSTLKFDFLIVDEAHEVRNPKTLAYNALLKIDARKRFLLSGTPAINGSNDIIALAGLLKIAPYDNKAWWKNPQDFSKDPTDPQDSTEVDKSTLIANWHKRYFYRIDKNKVLDLPPKTERTILIKLDEHQEAHYKKVESAVHPNKLVEILRLRQSVLLNPPNGFISQKYRVLENIVAKIPDDEAVLVFCSFRQALDEVHDYLIRQKFRRPIFVFNGQMNTEERKNAVTNFDKAVDLARASHGTDTDQKDSTADSGTAGERASLMHAPIFLISLKAGGVGLNLVKANHVILLDPYWNSAFEDQAIDRTHRIGQTRPVTVSRLIAENTIEQWVIGLQEAKNVEILTFNGESRDKILE